MTRARALPPPAATGARALPAPVPPEPVTAGGGGAPVPAAAALLALLAAAALAPPALAEDRALVIGIDDYTALARPVVLTQAAADARRFAAFLTASAGFAPGQVTVLTDADATSDRILGAVVNELLPLSAPGDRIVLYFAGLGTTVAGRDGALPALVAHEGDTPLGLIGADFLDGLLDQGAGRKVVLVFDTSFTDAPAPQGATARALASEAGPADLTAFGAGEGRDLWVAAAPGQFAMESAEGGVFTGYLLEGMGGIADADGDRIVTNGELAAHLAARSAAFCAALAPCAGTGLAPVTVAPEADPAFLPAHLLPQVADTGTLDTAPLTYDQMLAFVAELFGPTNPAGLELAIDAPAPMPIGAEVRFRATSDLSGALILLDIDTEGRLTRIFPSALAPDEGGAIRAGESVTIPSGMSANGLPLRVRVTGPAGRGILLALFTEGSAADLAQVLPPGLDDGALDEAGPHLFAIAQDLLRRDADPAARLGWSAAFLPYEVIP